MANSLYYITVSSFQGAGRLPFSFFQRFPFVAALGDILRTFFLPVKNFFKISLKNFLDGFEGASRIIAPLRDAQDGTLCSCQAPMQVSFDDVFDFPPSGASPRRPQLLSSAS